MAQRIKIRRDTAANWNQYNPILSLGEQGYETDTKQMKIGDGETAWNSLPYYRGFFTQALQDKLNGIAANAQVNTIQTISVNGTNVAPNAQKNVNIDLTKLNGIEAGAQVNKIETIKVNGITQPITGKTVDLKIDNKSVVKLLGVRRKRTSNTNAAWERTDDAVGLVANATKNGTAVQNDFDNIYPWSDIRSYMYNPTTKERIADYGDPNFDFNTTQYEIMTEIPEFYYRRYVESDYEYVKISNAPIDGFTKSPAFSVGRYETSYDGTKVHSRSNTFPEVNRNITSFRTLSNALGEGIGQLDYRYCILQLLYLVEYANFNTQNILGKGCTYLRVNDADKALVAESNTNRIIVTAAVAGNFIVGQQISIGTSSAWNQAVAKDRTITAIADYSSGGVTGKAITFDGAAVNIAVNNVIWTTGQKSGQLNSLGMKSGCLNNDGKHSVIYRGIENFFGNIYKFIDGINIKEHVAYVCYDPSQYVVDKFTSPYKAVGYTNANTNGWVKTLGYDEANPLIAFPTEVGASDSTGTCDNYYQNTGNRIALAGGSFHHTTYAGAWFWDLSYVSSHAYYRIGSRLLLNQ